MATDLPVARNLIKYHSNDLEEIENEDKEPIDKVYWIKSWPWIGENAIDFRLSDVQE